MPILPGPRLSPAVQLLHHPVAIGPFTARGNLFLAPVAGYSDAAYRAICRAEGADLCYTEMVSSEGLTRGHEKTNSLLERDASESEYAIQIFGAKPEVMAEAARALAPWKPALIDVNCGCPVPKIVKSGAGSALMLEPAKIGKIVEAMRRALDATGMASVPVTVKFRLGWDESSINYLEVAKIAEDGGAAALTLHARTRAQGYSGKADWHALTNLSASTRLPVFGSGDAFSSIEARRMLEETGVSGVMIARGAMGNPFVFSETLALLEGEVGQPPTRSRRIEVARRHLELSAHFIGERQACLEFRKHFCAYTKGEAGGASLRAEAVRATSIEEFGLLFRRWAEFA
ncbi:MAG: tRNA dihydrouridine synthase DusB [Treponema sp.]|nr:tRNA dihydrouridine synthase DusB [Treponema sp.]